MSIKPQGSYYWTLAANLVQAIASWLILLVVIRFGEKEDVGFFSFLQAVLVPVQLFFSLKLRTLQSADFGDMYLVSEYHRLRILSSCVSFLVSLIILWVIRGDVSLMLAGVCLAFSYSLYIVRKTLITVLLKANDSYQFFLINLFSSFLGVFAFSASYLASLDVVQAIFWMTAARALSYFTLEKKIFFSGDRVPEILQFGANDRKVIGRILRAAIPLGVTALVSALFASIPQIQIKNMIGLEELGVYAALVSVLVAFNLLVNSFAQSALPNLAKDYDADRKLFVAKVKRALIVTSLLSAAVYGFVWYYGEYVLLVLFGAAYVEYTVELNLVIVCGYALALFSIGSLVLSAQRSFFLQMPLYIVCALLIFIFTEIFIPRYGVAGGVLAQIVTYLLAFFASGAIFLAVHWTGRSSPR